MKKTLFKQFCIIFLICLLAELTIFNLDMYLSWFGEKPVSYKYTSTLGEMYKQAGSDYYIIPTNNTVTLMTEGPISSLDTLLVDIECIDEKGKAVQCGVTLSVIDEGHASFYALPKTTLYSSIEESKYINTYCYGDVIKLKILIDPEDAKDTYFKVNDIVYNANVPMFFSITRVLTLFVVLTLLWIIRPSSPLYNIKVSNQKKKIIICAVCTANILFFILLICFNTGFYNPGWTHHKQYHELAVSLTEGRTNIITGYEDLVSTITNPYDTTLRRTIMDSSSWDVWDLAFFEGKFYVYFGIVPVLIFYLPYYMLTGEAFPTNAGIFIMACLVLIGTFYLIWNIVKRYFKSTPFLLYLVVSFIAGNSIGTIPILMRPDFYSLPIICALAFTLWGLGLWFSAASLWTAQLATSGKHINRKIILRIIMGSLFMALTAGCRPQYLVGSFFIFFIFGPCIKQSIGNWNTRKELIIRTVLAAIPYILVAAGIMYYNYIRFGSPFDFGANYNLTTNDMTHRGFNMGRLADGIWMYLFQPPNMGMKFPYVFNTSFNSAYIGTTIREAMFGGAFFTQIITLALLALSKTKVRKTLKEKHLLGYCITSVVMAFIVVIADSEMAGILSRYYYDFLWLLIIPAVMVILHLWEIFKNANVRNLILTFVMVCFIFGLFINLAIGFQASSISSYNDYIYNYIKYLFS